MLKRKKRMQYDPPGSKKRGGKPGRTRRFDQIFLTRRVFMLKAVFVAGFATLTARLAQMQIVRRESYQTQAKDNVIGWKERKPTRGLIFDRAGRPLAENRRSWEVRVIPSELPDRGTPEWDTLRERLITALRLPDCLVIDPNSVPKGAETSVFTRVANLLGDADPTSIKKRIDFINISAKYNYVVLVDSALSSDDAARFNSKLQELPGVEVINYLDYLVRNFRYQSTPVTVKSDVAKDVALKLEANRLYLPGVELDDSVLLRRYSGGPVMSHILGYVGKIQDKDLNDPTNIDRVDPVTQLPVYKEYQPDDYHGQAGFERKLEPLLKGSKGGIWFEMDANGVELNQLAGETPPVPGTNFRMTIDLELQSAVSLALAEGIQFSTDDRKVKQGENQTPTRGGAVVIMSPKTGEVYSLVSYPNYDNQLFIDGLSELKAKEYGLGDPDDATGKKVSLPGGMTDPLTDRSAAGNFAPGSTIKPFIALAGLREKVITGDTTFDCTGAIFVPWTWDESKGNHYYCWIYNTGVGHDPVNVVQALEHSCDVFFYNVGTPRQKPEGAAEYLHYRDYFWDSKTAGEQHFFTGLGIQKIQRNLSQRFWFGKALGIDLPGEADGLVPDEEWKLKTLKDYWSSGDTINTSIGQGDFLASPLQIATNTCCLANGGYIYKPLIIAATVDDSGKDIETFKKQKLRRLNMNGEHIGLVREGMRRVVNEPAGTAHHSTVDGVQITKWPLSNPPDEEQIVIGGKTGTAEVGTVNVDGTYNESHAWFTCFAPFDDPEVVVTIFLERGGEGATYAVPVADKAMRAYFEMTGRRKRGVMLREDQKPINDENPPPNGTPGSEGTPNRRLSPEMTLDLGALALHHLGIVVADVDQAIERYSKLGFSGGERFEMTEQGVIAVTFHSGAGYVELIQPTTTDGPIARFMAKRGEGMHHIAYRVADLEATLASLSERGVRLIDAVPRRGAHDWRIAFVHPESCHGVLTELVDDSTT